MKKKRYFYLLIILLITSKALNSCNQSVESEKFSINNTIEVYRSLIEIDPEAAFEEPLRPLYIMDSSSFIQIPTIRITKRYWNLILSEIKNLKVDSVENYKDPPYRFNNYCINNQFIMLSNGKIVCTLCIRPDGGIKMNDKIYLKSRILSSLLLKDHHSVKNNYHRDYLKIQYKVLR